MSAPDVVYVDSGGALYDATAVGWNPQHDVHPLAGLCGPALQAPTHKPGCWLRRYPEIADICPCQPKGSTR